MWLALLPAAAGVRNTATMRQEIKADGTSFAQTGEERNCDGICNALTGTIARRDTRKYKENDAYESHTDTYEMAWEGVGSAVNTYYIACKKAHTDSETEMKQAEELFDKEKKEGLERIQEVEKLFEEIEEQDSTHGGTIQVGGTTNEIKVTEQIEKTDGNTVKLAQLKAELNSCTVLDCKALTDETTTLKKLSNKGKVFIEHEYTTVKSGVTATEKHELELDAQKLGDRVNAIADRVRAYSDHVNYESEMKAHCDVIAKFCPSFITQ